MANVVDCTEYYPFDAGTGGNSGESRWAVMARFFRNSGVIPAGELSDLSITTELDVFADSSGMLVKVRAGVAFVQGFVGRLDSQQSLDIATADGTYNRIDLVVARLNRTDQKVQIAVVTGTPAATPSAPDLTQNSVTWEIPLAEVLVDNGVSTIAAIKVSRVADMSLYHRDFVFEEVSGATTVEAGKGYIPTHDSTTVVFTLPESPRVGDAFAIIGEGDAGWELKSNSSVASQKIIKGGRYELEGVASSSSAIKLMENESQYDSVVLRCVVAGSNQIWVLDSGTGDRLVTVNYFGSGSDGDVTISADTNLTSTQDSDMIVKHYNSLTIDSGYTLSVSNRCKGLLIYVKGNLVVNGSISMSKKGASADPVAAGVNTNGLRLTFKKSTGTDTLAAADLAGCGTAAIAAAANHPAVSNDGIIVQVPRAGAGGGTGPNGHTAGDAGDSGSNAQTGGGGSGGACLDTAGYAGDGAAGTCFSGGSAGGGTADGGSAGDGTANGGAGGSGYNNGQSDSSAGGGAGNPAGSSAGGDASAADSGTGGLLIIIVGGDVTIGATGVIQADGGDGGDVVGADFHRAGGGGSGGGSLNIIHRGTYTNNGSVHANGGAGGTGVQAGGDGGAGTVNIYEVD